VSAPFDRVITGTNVTTGAIPRAGHVAVRGEIIAAIGQGAPPPAAATIFHGDNLISPGVVDGHMHTSSSTGWPGIETASRCAAAGGVTTGCGMPYDVPVPVTGATLLRDKIGWLERTLAGSMADLEIFEMALETGAHVHIAHSSIARGFTLAEQFRAAGVAGQPRARPGRGDVVAGGRMIWDGVTVLARPRDGRLVARRGV
jgi:dihydroorotase-like cyclic amidohydrolase